MSRFNMSNYEPTFTENLAFVQKELNGKNIIQCFQYIVDDETQIDGDGPQSWWSVEFLCIEKTDDDYIFHTFAKNNLHSYSYPHFVRIDKNTSFSIKLSSLKIQVDNSFDKGIYEISNFISRWENSYCHALVSKDTVLMKELQYISSKIDDLNEILTKQYEKDEKQSQEYMKSPEYQARLEEDQKARDLYKKQEEEKYEKQEQKRLKLCIEAHGEVEGTRLWQRL
jgi:hypothetical protein